MVYWIFSFWNLLVILEAAIVHATRLIAINCYVNSTQKIEKTKKKLFFSINFSVTFCNLSQNKPTSNVGWKVLFHPLCSSDLPLSDYHLFRSMTHGLSEQHYSSYGETKKWVDSWIASKDEQSFRRGIHLLPERWEKVIASDGQYFDWNIL